MRIHSLAAAGLATALACTPADATVPPAQSPTSRPLTATAVLTDRAGATIGSAVLTEQGPGVRITLTASKLTAGAHGWHIHAVGRCELPDFATAGGHFNPDNRQHGAHNPQGAHAGDLGNLIVNGDGIARADIVAILTLGVGARSVFDADGTAIVI